MIKLISFDVWNTLLRLDTVFHRIAEEIALDVNLSKNIVLEKVLASYKDAKKRRKLGLLREDSIVLQTQEFMAQNLGIDIDILRRALARAFLGLGEEVLFDDLDVLEKLRDRGFKIGIVGNTLFWPSSYTRMILEKLGLAKYIDRQVYADEVKISKPDRRIFLYLCRELDIEPEEAVHVGDGLVEDVGGALSAGMKAVLIKRSSDMFTVIKDLGIAVIPDMRMLIKAIEMLS